MPKNSLKSHPIPNRKPAPSVPWFESNLLWGGIGILLTVVGAMRHNLLWLLWLAWLCFIVTLWRGTRGMERFRLLSRTGGFILVSGLLLGLKIWLFSTPTLATAPPHPSPPQNSTPIFRDTQQLAATHETAQPSQPSVVPKERPTKRKTAPPLGSIHGTDNTIVGIVPNRSIEGDGNTIVGATDSNGNTILNRGGTAIGNGAEADPSSIAIGAHAKAGITKQSFVDNEGGAVGSITFNNSNIVGTPEPGAKSTTVVHVSPYAHVGKIDISNSEICNSRGWNSFLDCINAGSGNADMIKFSVKIFRKKIDSDFLKVTGVSDERIASCRAVVSEALEKILSSANEEHDTVIELRGKRPFCIVP